MNKDNIITGEVVYVRHDEYLVDVGTGEDAALPFSEATNDHNVGDQIEVIVLKRVDGENIVSEKKIESLKKQLEMDDKVASNEMVHGKITGFNKGQFLVKIDGNFEGLCYIKELEPFFIENGEDYIGKEYDFFIIGKGYGRYPKYKLSRRALIENQQKEKREAFGKVFSLDGELKGNVTKQIPSGIIVAVEDFECFIPKSEITYDVNIVLPEVGSQVEFKIIRVEEDRFNAVGSIKALLVDPWTHITNYNKEEIYKAPITRVESYGIFVDLGEGLNGLIHVSELSHDFIDDTSVYNVGDIQEFKLIDVDNKKKQVKLSTKAIYPSKYEIAKEEFTLGQHLVLPVTKFYRSGIFVRLMDKYDVFVKNEEIHNHTQTRPMLKINSKLDFILLDFNDEREEVVLSNQAYVAKETQIFEEAIN